jgi:catechol 2,3-dioxygenase-like lactoylglutathione lyase family enzyme
VFLSGGQWAGILWAVRINHVSISAKDLESSVDFYVDVLGAQPVATPDFGLPVQWLAIGDCQLHIFQAPVEPLSHHHFAITVEDLEPVYRRIEARGAFDHEAFGNHLVELPGDLAQTYMRDPAGNLVELDALGAGRLSDELKADLRVLADVRPQTGEHALARLPLGY